MAASVEAGPLHGNSMELNSRASEKSNLQDYATSSKIVNFYHNRSILITGASGFIGKVLIEKLLRTCTGLKNIFVLIRPKRDQSPEERLNGITNSTLFESIKNEQDGHKLINKIKVLDGDITEKNFGLNDESMQLIIDEVSVVFHSAATVRFDEPVKRAVSINIVGVQNLIEICRQLNQLVAVVHISTAYANCDKDTIDEHLYPVDIEPEKLIHIADWLDQDTVQLMKHKLVGPKPNTYTYTKSLAEYLLFEKARDLPVVICRPSIVCASMREPFAGWIDNVNGPTGIILGAAKGLIRTMYAQSSYVADLIPVDYVINLAITLGWFASRYHNIVKISSLGMEDSIHSSIGWSNSVSSATSGHESSLGEEHSDSAVNSGSECDEKVNNQGAITNEDEDYGSGLTTYMRHLKSPSDSLQQHPSSSGSSSLIDEPSGPISIESPKENLGDNQNNHQDNPKSYKPMINEDDQAKMIQFRNVNRAKLIAKNLPEEYADIPVFHCTSGSKKPITWGQIQHLVIYLCTIFPSSQMLRYPNGSFTNKRYWDRLNKIVLHYIPGYIVDLITRLSGGKPILVRIYRKFDQAADVLQAFTMKQWHFDTSNNLMLQDELMSNEDKLLFNFDIDRLNWREYMEIYVLGVRRFMLKESIDNLDEARKNLNFVYYRNLALQITSFAIVMYILLSKYL